MENQYWKRELFQAWHRDATEDKWKTLLRNLRSSKAPSLLNDDAPTRETIFSEQISHDAHGDGIMAYPLFTLILSLVVVCCGIIACFVYFYKKSNLLKKFGDIDKQKSTSILIYPSKQTGQAPQYMTKEIHFSLPPLKSNSLGDLTEPDNPYDSDDVDTESLLFPATHSHRSNSFSCYGLGVIEPALYKSTLDLDEIQWPEGHIGRLWFSLRYEPSTEKLLVSLLKAKNLPSRTVGTVNSCDPFVRLHLMPDERRYLQSKQKKKTCNPYFDETLVFQVSAKDMADHTLKLTVIDGGRTKRRSEIGHVTFPLKDLEIGDGTEQQLFKLDLEKVPNVACAVLVDV